MPSEKSSGLSGTAIDLFSGAGGLTLGLKLAEFSVVGAIEVDPFAVDTYRMNHREVNVWERDIRSVAVSEVMSVLGLRPGDLDLLAGCPPCQGFSTLRTKRRVESVVDSRNDLVFEMVRFARALQPKAVMIENVPNLARDRRISLILDELRNLGYYVNEHSLRVLDAADYGVPQRRRRMILLAGRTGIIDFAPRSSARRSVASAIGKLDPPGDGDDPLHDYHIPRSERIMELIRHIPKNGGSRRDLPETLQLSCHQRSNGYSDVYGRMAWDKVAPTITSGSVGLDIAIVPGA